MSTSGSRTRKTPHDGEGSRRALLDAAEELFALQGVNAVSIRAINSAAGLAPAAVHYHFGSREALLEAVLSRRATPLLMEMSARAEVLLSQPSPPSAREVLEGFLMPHIALARSAEPGGARWTQILVQQDILRGAAYTELSLGTGFKFQEVLHRAFPDEETAVLEKAWGAAINAALVMIAMGCDPESNTVNIDEALILDFAEGGIATAMHGMKLRQEEGSRRG